MIKSLFFFNKDFSIGKYLIKRKRVGRFLLIRDLSKKNEEVIKLRKKNQVYLDKDLYLKKQPNSFFFLNEIRKIFTPIKKQSIGNKKKNFYFRERKPATQTSFFYSISDIEEESGMYFLTLPFLWLGCVDYFFVGKKVIYSEINRTQIDFKIEMCNDNKKILPTKHNKKEKINLIFLKQDGPFFLISFEFFSEIKSICIPEKNSGSILEPFLKYQKLLGTGNEIFTEAKLKNFWGNNLIFNRKYSSRKIGLINRLGENLIFHQKWCKVSFRYFSFFEKNLLYITDEKTYPLTEKKFIFSFSGFIPSKICYQNFIKIGKSLSEILLTCDTEFVPFKMLVLIECNFSKSDWLIKEIEKKKEKCNFKVIFKNLNNDITTEHVRELVQEIKKEGFQTILLIANFEILILSKMITILTSLSFIQLSKFFAGIKNSVSNKKKNLFFLVKGSRFSFFGIPLDTIKKKNIWAHYLITQRTPVRICFFFRDTQRVSVVTIDFTLFFFFIENKSKNGKSIDYFREKDLNMKKKNSVYFFSIIALFRWISGLVIEKNIQGKERSRLLKFSFVILFLVNNYIENQKSFS